jgi:conjugative transfer signal peptidase TraF
VEAGEQSDWVVGQDKGPVLLRYALRLSGAQNNEFAHNARVTGETLRNKTRITECNAGTTASLTLCRPGFSKLERKFWRAALLFGGVLSAALLAWSLGRFFELRITLTDSSAPAGVYRQVNTPAGRGALVAACLPERIAQSGRARGYLRSGDCPAQAEPVAKVIDAIAGDALDIEPDRVTVNGMRFANSRTALRDSKGRLLPHVPWGMRRVAPGEVWLFGFHNIRSWDGRYFGPIPSSAIYGVLQPVITW